MAPTLLAALLLTATIDETARYLSPNGEMCVIISDLSEPHRAVLYHLWPGDYRELLAEFELESGEHHSRILVSTDGQLITVRPLLCSPTADLLTIRAADGTIVRTLRVRDVMTANDQNWLCRGSETDVRFAVSDSLRMTVLVSDSKWEAPEARHHTIEVDLATGAAPAPEGDLCPAAVRITAEPEDNLPRFRSDVDVVSITSHELLARALVRVTPEYPEVAVKARVAGPVGVQVVVSTDGKVESATIVKPLPFGLDEAVRKAVAGWEFMPDSARVSGTFAFYFEILRPYPIVTISCH